jgi:hypothetical protein
MATVAGNNSNESQLSRDLTSLGSALSAGDFSTAQSALATVQADLESSASPSQTTETNAPLAVGIISFRTAQHPKCEYYVSATSDLTNSVLEHVYGSRSLNVQA